MGGMLLKTGLFSSLQQWLLTADMKEMTVNSIGNARSVLIQSVSVSADF